MIRWLRKIITRLLCPHEVIRARAEAHWKHNSKNKMWVTCVICEKRFKLLGAEIDGTKYKERVCLFEKN